MCVQIRPLKREDLRILYRLMHPKQKAIPEWKQWDAPYYPYRRPSFYSFKRQMVAGMIDNMRYLILKNDEVIGMVTYYWEHRASYWLEAGIVIFNPQYWSGGIGTKAMFLWIDTLFNHLPIVRCGYTTWSGNERMMRVGEKLGMTLEARLRKCRYFQGEYYDSIRYGILKEEWLQNRDVLKKKIFNEC